LETRKHTILILGGWGLVGSAIVRAMVGREPKRRPRTVVIHSLLEDEARKAVAALEAEDPEGAIRFVPEWGNIFVRAELKDTSRDKLLKSHEARRVIVADTMDDLTSEILGASALYQLLVRHRPEVVIDCINTATAFAYQNVFSSVHEVRKTLEASRGGGAAEVEALREAIEAHLMTLTVPPLVRHIQIALQSFREAGIRAYLKIGTTGTGGMGLNIPYTHSEEQPSRLLLSKSATAGAHSMLLYLLARTPGAPLVVKEIKPSAVIAWKRIDKGPVLSRGSPILLYDCAPEQALDVAAMLQKDPEDWNPLKEGGEDRVLESVFIDTGENGMFSSEEFETVTALGQMGFVTPEEIADAVLMELGGGTTGREVVAALDGATLGPSYRAGVMRHHALEEMREQERKTGLSSVAFENLGPPRLSKLLYEAHLLKRSGLTLVDLAACDPQAVRDDCVRLVTGDKELRARILSIGIPILLPDGRLLRGREIKVPTNLEEARAALNPEAIEQWAESGWVDLRTENIEHWRKRARDILDELERHSPDDSSSRLYEDRSYWRPTKDLPAGRVAAWILGVESGGARGKAQ